MAKKAESEFQAKNEIWPLEDLQVNITKHHLVPTHSVLNDEDKHELLKKYRIKEHQLPKI